MNKKPSTINFLRKDENCHSEVRPDLNIKFLTGQRDRTTIYQANARAKSVFDRLGAGHGHDPGNPAVAQQGVVQYRRVPDSATHSGSWLPGHPFKVAGFEEADRAARRAVDGIVEQAGEISKIIPLAALLDSRGGGNNIGVNNESDMYGHSLKKKKKKKRRKKKRRVGVVICVSYRSDKIVGIVFWFTGSYIKGM